VRRQPQPAAHRGDDLLAGGGEAMKTVTLTPLQLQTLTAIQRHITEHGRPPTARQLRPALGLRSTNSVFNRLKSLRRTGALVPAPRYSIGTVVPKLGVQVVVMYE
jgi:SOS-response transcriptional repressor LexA